MCAWCLLGTPRPVQEGRWDVVGVNPDAVKGDEVWEVVRSVFRHGSRGLRRRGSQRTVRTSAPQCRSETAATHEGRHTLRLRCLPRWIRSALRCMKERLHPRSASTRRRAWHGRALHRSVQHGRTPPLKRQRSRARPKGCPRQHVWKIRIARSVVYRGRWKRLTGISAPLPSAEALAFGGNRCIEV